MAKVLIEKDNSFCIFEKDNSTYKNEYKSKNYFKINELHKHFSNPKL